MATATLRLSAPPPARTATETARPSKGWLSRFYNALIEARMRQAMREIAMHRHLLSKEEVRLPDPVPQDEVKRAGYQATFADAGLLPFVR
jgi:hypothetical protein